MPGLGQCNHTRSPCERRKPRSAATEETIARARQHFPCADLKSVSRLDKEARCRSALPLPGSGEVGCSTLAPCAVPIWRSKR
jgi:hypothetical protein